MKAEYFPPKEDVILPNEAPTDFYILVTGAMELLVSKNKVEQVYGEAKTGDLCGEYRPQLFTVRTKRLGQLLHLNRATFLSIVQSNVGDGTIFLNNLPQHLKELKDPVMEGVLVETENMLVRGRMDLPLTLCFAACRGYKPSTLFQSKSTEAVVNELGASLLSGLDADERTEYPLAISGANYVAQNVPRKMNLLDFLLHC
ncbi:RAC-alpha serine/threonine-protein kinase [Orobanche hederae]